MHQALDQNIISVNLGVSVWTWRSLIDILIRHSMVSRSCSLVATRLKVVVFCAESQLDQHQANPSLATSKSASCVWCAFKTENLCLWVVSSPDGRRD